jgi:hypothetical protein
LSDVIKQLEDDLKKILNYQNGSDFSGQIRTLKNPWGKGDKDRLHNEIKTLKTARSLSYAKVNQLKDELAQNRQQLYFKQIATRYHAKLPKAKEPSLSNRTVIKKGEKGLSNAETRELTTLTDFLFAGVDNGLIKMTTSVLLSLQRAKFHLKLYNHYAALESREKDGISQLDLADEEKSFLNLPEIIEASADDVDLDCGYSRQRKKLK